MSRHSIQATAPRIQLHDGAMVDRNGTLVIDVNGNPVCLDADAGANATDLEPLAIDEAAAPPVEPDPDWPGGFEAWRPLPLLFFDRFYMISSLGRIWKRPYKDRLGRQRVVHMPKYTRNDHGYLTVRLSVDGHRARPYVHTLVALAFLGPCPPGKREVNHKDGNKKNNRVSNLEWVTASENRIHSYRNGLSPSGDRHHFSKKQNIAGTVFELAETGLAYKEIAKAAGCSIGHVTQLMRGRAGNNQPDRPPATRKRHWEQLIRDADVPTIFALYRQGMGKTAIARRYGATYTAVYCILTGRTHKNAPRS